MKCSVSDRLILLQVLNASPIMGSYLTIKIARKLRENLSFSEAEHKEIGLVVEGQQVHWDVAKDIPKEIEMGDKALELIKTGFKALEEKHLLGMEYLDLYEKFMVEPLVVVKDSAVIVPFSDHSPDKAGEDN